jgi:hypothetical protein
MSDERDRYVECGRLWDGLERDCPDCPERDGTIRAEVPRLKVSA